VELWSLETGKVRTLESSFNALRGAADCIAFSSDNSLLAVYYRDRGITLWHLSTQSARCNIPIPLPSWVTDMAFAEGHGSLVTVLSTGMLRPGWNHSAVRWDVATGNRLESHVFDRELLLKALSPNGRYAVMQQQNVGQIVFDLRTGKKAFGVFSEGDFRFSGDGSKLVSYRGGQIVLWEAPSGRELRRFDVTPGHGGATSDVSLSHDGKLLAVGGFTATHVVGLISLESGRVLAEFECGPEPMLCDVVCFSPDGRILATDTDNVNRNDRDVEPLLRFWRIPREW
jgi:WD40 repeat protein